MQGQQPIADHLADFETHLESRGNTAKHIDNTVSMIRQVIAECSFKTLADIDANKVAMHVNDLRRQGKGLRSINKHLGAAKQFVTWLWRADRLRTDLLKPLSKLNAVVDRRHRRRALTEDEIRRLLEAAEVGPDWIWRIGLQHSSKKLGMTGQERALLYRICLETGVRASEAGSLKPSSFDLANLNAATVSIEAGYSKHRREDVLPIRRDLAERIQQYIARKHSQTLLFNMPKKPARMLRPDLAAPGIAYRDEAGRVADFYALRHTFISRLVRSGIAPALAKKLARHSTITLTLDHYTHIFIDDERALLEKLPDLDENDGGNIASSG